jgi:hypothetical protein
MLERPKRGAYWTYEQIQVNSPREHRWARVSKQHCLGIQPVTSALLRLRRIEPRNPIGPAMVNDEASGAIRPDVHRHFSPKVKWWLPHRGPDRISPWYLITHRCIPIEVTVSERVSSEARVNKAEVRTIRQADRQAHDACRDAVLECNYTA